MKKEVQGASAGRTDRGAARSGGWWRLAVLAAVFFGLAMNCWLKAPDELSDSERRALAQMPEFSAETVLDGSFMTDFESYTLDQFPLRDSFRSLKAVTEYGPFLKKDNNGIYIRDGYAAQILYPYNEESVENAAARFQHVYDTYLKGTGSEGRIFAAIAPDKGYFLAEKNGYPSLDYNAMTETLQARMDFAKYIDLTGSLTLEDYYKTDSHWRQERLTEVAGTLGEAMGLELTGLGGLDAEESGGLEPVIGLTDFHGVYYGQSALPLPGESLIWLTSEEIEGCKAYNFETGETLPVYQTEKLEGKDPYDVFLGGAAALVTVENPAALAADNQRELILFRDSFGSSLAPLLLESYGRITLVDLRYVQSDYLGEFLDFHGQDVLFLYGTAVLNDSYTLK